MAQTQSNCVNVVDACKKALDSKNKAIQLSDIAITNLKTQNGLLTTEVEELRESNSSFFKNPFVMFLLGAGVASTSYLLLKK